MAGPSTPAPPDSGSPAHAVLWLTDIHLNFLTRAQVSELVGMVNAQKPRAILLGGDIGEADTVAPALEMLASAWSCPIYFVLGNHDFYRGSIAAVRQRVSQLSTTIPRLHYLTMSEDVVKLSDSVGLIGHDGWADARVGDYMRSLVMMNDYRLIAELRDHDKVSRLPELRRLGDEAGAHIGQQLQAAIAQYEQVVLLTHVPPFREACWYEGRMSDDEWAPHFTCMAVGEAIRDVMRTAKDKQLTVLCGHTHGEGVCHPLPNVTVITGGAEYGTVRVTQTFDW